MNLALKLQAIDLLELLRERSDRAVAEAQERTLEAARHFGPSPLSAHPYSTGAFVASLRWEGDRLVSDVPYAPYTDGGYTRQRGAGTARRWLERGGVAFGEHYLDLFVEIYREAWRNG